jgi:hypothetical protein
MSSESPTFQPEELPALPSLPTFDAEDANSFTLEDVEGISKKRARSPNGTEDAFKKNSITRTVTDDNDDIFGQAWSSGVSNVGGEAFLDQLLMAPNEDSLFMNNEQIETGFQPVSDQAEVESNEPRAAVNRPPVLTAGGLPDLVPRGNDSSFLSDYNK